MNHFTQFRIKTENPCVYVKGEKLVSNLVRALEFIDNTNKIYDSNIEPNSYNNFTEWSIMELDSVAPNKRNLFENDGKNHCICGHISETLHTIGHKDGKITAYIGTKCFKRFSASASRELKIAGGSEYCRCGYITCSRVVIQKPIVDKYKALGMTVFYKKKCLKKYFIECYDCGGFQKYDCSCLIIESQDQEFKTNKLLNHHIIHYHSLVVGQKLFYTYDAYKSNIRKIVYAIVEKVNYDKIVFKNSYNQWVFTDKQLRYKNFYIENNI